MSQKSARVKMRAPNDKNVFLIYDDSFSINILRNKIIVGLRRTSANSLLHVIENFLQVFIELFKKLIIFSNFQLMP